MGKLIDLIDVLKGHEGEEFYTTTHGEVIYCGYEIEKRPDGKRIIKVQVKDNPDINFQILSTGQLYEKGDLIFFPSQKQKSWERWIEECKLAESFKTWEDIVKNGKSKCRSVEIKSHLISSSMIDLIKPEDYVSTGSGTKEEKSALAVLLIHQLIESSYGGYRENSDDYYIVYYPRPVMGQRFWVVYSNEPANYGKLRYGHPVLRFKSQQYAGEFLKYPSNVKLIEDLFMISN